MALVNLGGYQQATLDSAQVAADTYARAGTVLASVPPGTAQAAPPPAPLPADGLYSDAERSAPVSVRLNPRC
jgi:hypothetical protein